MQIFEAIICFVLATTAIAFLGTWLAKSADKLADVTGMGEAMFGAIFLGSVTSLSGIVTSVVAASNGHPELAISNAIGGIAVQTFFLSIADIAYSRGNLEHAAASFTNLMQGVLLICLLSIIIMGAFGPDTTILGFHPFSLLVIIVYLIGSRVISNARTRPMWSPMITQNTVQDIPNDDNKNLRPFPIIIRFSILAICVGFAGYLVARSGISIAEKSGLSDGVVGTLFTAVATSLPELIVSVAAVRQGALTLAVGNIIGGNTFDVLFVSFSDLAYQEGSILHAISGQQYLVIGATMLMTSVLILGLLFRQKQGPGKIGWESVLIIAIYLVVNIFLSI